MTARYPVPDSVFAQHSAWLATSGAGKTTAVKGGVERLLADGKRVVVVDPTGVWWGLRFAADGRRASRFPIVVFGREHADLPLDEGSGEAVARALGASSTSAILSLKGMRVAERNRFATAFFETLVAANRGELHLVVDEVHLFAPQSGGTGLTPAMLHATNNLVSTGRAAGLAVAMISQRPAKVHKDSLTQAASLVALRCAHPLDQRPIRDWLSTTEPDKARRAEILASLAGLPTGEGWLSAPQEGVLARVAFPMIATFDSSRRGVEEIPLKPLDVGALRATLRDALAGQGGSSSSREKGGAGDGTAPAGPGAAQREIAAARQAGEGAGYARGLVDGEARGLERGVAAGWRAAVECIRRDFDQVSEKVGEIASIETPRQHPDGEDEVARALLAAWPKVDGGSAPPAKPSPEPPKKISGADKSVPMVERVYGLNSAARKMLAVLDTNPPVRRSWRQVATLAGLRARGGHFNTGRKALLESGRVLQEGELVAIAAPSAGASPAVADPAALVELWCASLRGAAPHILRLLLDAREAGAGTTRAQIAQLLGLAPRGGHWNAAWKELRDNGLVVVEGDDARLGEVFAP